MEDQVERRLRRTTEREAFFMSADETQAALAEEARSTEERPADSECTVVPEEGCTAKFGETPAAAEEVVGQQTTGTQADENESVQLLSKRVEQLAGLLEEANVLSRGSERIVDRLHQENQDLRAGELWQAVVPIFRDLIRLYDDLDLTTHRYEARTDLEKEAARDFQSFRDAVEDLLYRHGVERYTASEGVAFNSKEHKALGIVPTQDENLDRTLARVVRSGFRTDARAVRILEAEVFRFSAAVTPPSQEDVLKRESETAD
jgi:molecular chaperone GrpE